MKFKILFLSIYLLSSSFIQIHGNSQDIKWKGTIEYEDGIKVIKNPNEPLYGEISFELEEDLSIGNEDDENYLFFRIQDIKVDKEGNVYVLDTGNSRVQKFDENGNYLNTIGRQGQGPGEFQTPVQLVLDGVTGNIYVKEYPRLKIFNKDGKYLKDIVQRKFPFDFIIDKEGNIWGIFSMVKEKGHSNVFCKANLKGEIIKSYAEFPIEITNIQTEEGAVFIKTGEEFALHFSSINEKHFVYGFSKNYVITAIDEKGNLLYILEKNERPRLFTAEEKNKRKIANLPEHVPYFYSIFTDSEGRIYIQRNNNRRTQQGPHEYDIFSSDGYYLYRCVLPYPPSVLENGYFYTRYVNDDTGEELVKRFRIKNWSEIKKSI